jgi:hypothetical protein
MSLAIPQCNMTVIILIKLVTEKRKDPLMISDMKPDRIAISGENAPNSAPTTLNPPIELLVALKLAPALSVAAKSGNIVKITTTTKSRKDRTLNVSAAVAKFVLVSGILC